jgi:hypothetical protein
VFLSVKIAHLLVPQGFVGFLPQAFVYPVVLVDSNGYRLAWLIAYSPRDDSGQGQPSDNVRVVLSDLLLDREEKCLHIERSTQGRSVGAAYTSCCSLDTAQGVYRLVCVTAFLVVKVSVGPDRASVHHL